MFPNDCVTGGKLANRYFICVCIVAFTYHFGLNASNSTFTIYLRHLGYEPSLNGIIAIPASLTAMAFRIVSAHTTDNIGRRFTIILGLAIYGICIFMTGAIPVIGVIIVFRILQAAGFSTVNTGSSAANIDVAPPDKVGLGSAIFFLMVTLSMLIVGLIMSYFVDRGAFSTLYALAAGIIIASIAAAAMMNYEKKPEYQKLRAEERQLAPPLRGINKFFFREALPIAAVSTLQSLGFSCAATYLPLFGKEMGIPGYGQFFIVSAFVAIISNLSASKIIGRGRPLPVLLPCYAASALGFLWLTLAPSAASYFAMAAAYGTMFGFCTPVLYGEAMRLAPATRRGAASGTLMLATDIGMGLGNAIWGIMITAAGFSAAFAGAAAFYIAAAIFGLFIFKAKGVVKHAN